MFFYKNTNMKVPFSPPRIDDLIIHEVVQALQSGWITTGPKTKEFERQLATYCDISHVLCLNSASAGLELILHWFGIGAGDEVIIPAYTYAATANVIIHCGATPVMVDVNNDFNISVEAIKKAITPRTKVIIPVDIGGFPCDYDEINSLVKEPTIRQLFSPSTDEQQQLGRILVLSDAAHSIGAVYKGKKSGKLTDISVFSFHAVKNLTTAEGGAICLNLPSPFVLDEVYKTLSIKSLHGQTKDALSKMQLGNWRYDIVEAGFKCNMTDVLAAIGMVELSRYEADMLKKRKEIFQAYTRAFQQYEQFIIPPFETETKTSSYHVYLLRIKNITEKERDEIITRIFDREVAVNVHFVPLPLFTFYKKLGYKIEDYPMAYQNYVAEISLPVYYDLTEEQLQWVIESVLQAVQLH